MSTIVRNLKVGTTYGGWTLIESIMAGAGIGGQGYAEPNYNLTFKKGDIIHTLKGIDWGENINTLITMLNGIKGGKRKTQRRKIHHRRRGYKHRTYHRKH